MPSRERRELARVLRPGGRAAFSEPLGTNPVVQFVRDHVPYPHKHERGADIPLRRSDIDAWMAPFAEAHLQGVQLFSMLERGLGFHRKLPVLREYDRLLLKRWPELWPLCRYCGTHAPALTDASSVVSSAVALDFARWRAALARLPHVDMSHQRRRPVREVS